ncbi:hypothetical protein [Streptomyces alboniger]|uniref:ATP-binding protein n=1 Tax=Streptomyces alboniger TaxID=132473 RepID=A0A5J6HXK3_STRAD|nr:hypothetical protein [Streptomyces alboniger]QEV21727.1 hypothetical protein CP975_33180 [Streptomyces alboniger]
MSNQKRAIAVLTLAAAALAMGGPAEAAATAVHEGPAKDKSVGTALGETLADPGTTSKHVIKGTKQGLAIAKAGFEATQGSMMPRN